MSPEEMRIELKRLGINEFSSEGRRYITEHYIYIKNIELKIPTFKVGKEIDKKNYKICPKCKGILVPRNGSNNCEGFSLDPCGSNWWECSKCRRKFEVLKR